MKKRWKMRLKILILCLGSTFLGLFLQTWLFQNSSSKIIYNQAKDDSYRSMQNMQSAVETFIKTIEDSLLSIYNETDLVNDLRRGVDAETIKENYFRAAYNLATENFETSSRVMALYLYNSDHQIIDTYRKADTPIHSYPLDIYEDPEYTNAEKVKEYVESSETQMMVSSYYNESREKNMVRFVLKIFNSHKIDKAAGYLVCDIDLAPIQKILEKFRLDDSMYIWLQPVGDRAIISTGTLSGDSGEDYEKVSQEVYEGNQLEDDLNGEDKIFYAVYQEKYNLGAYSLFPRALLNKNQQILSQNLLLITVIMLIVISISFVVVSRTLTRPLEKMMGTMKRIQDGETELRIENPGTDEVGELGKSFNSMLDQIEGLIAREYENKLLLNQAQYQTLQAQINPHFLYNTLDTMASIAEVQNCTQVSALCQSLAGIFRYSLNMKEPLSTLGEEILHLKNYIYVMNVRMQNQIQYKFQIEDTVLKDTLPRLSLQPLVENAITHGLKNRKGSKEILVAAGRKEGVLVILVEDNGIGMTEERIGEIYRNPQENRSHSIGIVNIHRRMQLIYGEQYGVEIESSPDKGTKVFLKIPEDNGGGKELWKP